MGFGDLPVGAVTHAGDHLLIFCISKDQEALEVGVTDGVDHLYKAHHSLKAMTKWMGDNVTADHAEEKLRAALMTGAFQVKTGAGQATIAHSDSPDNRLTLPIVKSPRPHIAKLLFWLGERNRELEKESSLAKVAANSTSAVPESSGLAMGTRKRPAAEKVDPSKRSVVGFGRYRKQKPKGAVYEDDE